MNPVVPSTKKPPIAIWLGLIALSVFFAFGLTLKAGFINWDDDTHLTDNPTVQVHRLADIQKIFTSTVNQTYIPLTILSFAVEHRFFGFNPFVFHFDNLILHLSVALLAFWLGRIFGLLDRAAFIAAIVFGIHPMHVESVAWVTERKDVLYALFYMLALIAYSCYVREKKKSALTLCFIFGILSLLAKPMALSLPLVLFVLDWFLKRKIDKKSLLEKIPLILIFIPLTWITYSMNARVPGHHFFESMLTWIWTFSFYFRKFFLPLALSPLYIFSKPVSLMNPEYWIALAVFLVFWYLLISRRHDRLVVFAGLFYLASIFFLLRFDDTQDNHMVADRFMYLPSLGFCFLIGAKFDEILEYFKKRKWPLAFRTVGISFIILLCVLGGQTREQTRHWKDSITFWDWLISKRSNFAQGYNYRGVAYVDQHQYDRAVLDFNRAVQLKPDYVKAYYNLGLCYQQKGQYDLATRELTRAIQLDPECQRCYIERALVYKNKGDRGHAIDDLSQAIRLTPQNLKFYLERASLFYELKNYDAALQDYASIIKLYPDEGGAYYNMGVVLSAKNEAALALANLLKAKSLGYPVSDEYIERVRVSVRR